MASESFENEVMNMINRLVPPHVPAVEILEAVMKTVTNPSIITVEEDLALAFHMAEMLKQKLAGKHAGIWEIIQILFDAK